MIIVIPYGSDANAGVPKATIGLMVVNTLAFAVTCTMEPSDRAVYALSRGAGLHPLEWLTSFFMHADIMHLVGNMVFLWAFGLVVEARLGVLKFLLVYLGIGLLQAAAMQVISLHDEGGHILGASAAIYGLMGLAMIWMPTNTLSCFYFIWFLRIFTGTTDIAIFMFALFYIGWEALVVFFTRAAMSTPLLHLSGALIGLGLGVVMLKTRLVDCENWDIFAVMMGREGKYAKKKRSRVARARPAAALVGDSPDDRPTAPRRRREAAAEGFEDPLAVDPARAATERLRRVLNSDQGPVAAHATYDRLMRTVAGWTPDDRTWLQLIKALLDVKETRLAVGVMEDYLRRSPEPSPRVRLKLAQILLREYARPSHALRVLQGFDGQPLPADLEAYRAELTREAQQQSEDGAIELGGDAW